MATSRKVTAVIPVFNEADTVPTLICRLDAVAEELGADYSFNYLFVNDGSTDQTCSLLQAARDNNPAVGYLSLSRNFGHQAALSAGLAHCPDSDFIVMMDGDLQDPPEAISDLLEKAEGGFDVVYAIRGSRPEGIIKRLCYRLFYKFANGLSSVPLPIESGDFSVMNRRVLQAITDCGEKQRYLRGLRSYVGFRQSGIVVDREARYSGRPKYTLGKLISLALDGLFSFSVIPLRAAWVVGIGGIMSCLAYTAYALFMHLMTDSVPAGFTGVIAVVTFIGSLQLFFIGVVGEYVGRVHIEVKRRPDFIIDWDNSDCHN